MCELLLGGTLAHHIHGETGARRPPTRPLVERLRLALDVARGMQALEQVRGWVGCGWRVWRAASGTQPLCHHCSLRRFGWL